MDVTRDSGIASRASGLDPALPGPPVDHVAGLAGLSDVVAVSARAAGQVFRAREAGGDRPVAVKIYSAAVPADAVGDRAALERRIGAAQQLGGHPHLVDVLRFGVVATGQPFVVMPWYDHGSLADHLWRRGPLPLGDVLRTGAGVASGLGYAHAFGFVHRAVKPTNVLVSMLGEPALADFAVAVGDDDGATRTSPYAPPELWDGEPATAAADVWSLAATLYAALAGRPPFGPGSPPRLGDVPLPPLPRSDVPRTLSALLEAALSRRPEDRPAAAEIADHLAWIGRQHGAAAGDGPGVGADTTPRGARVRTAAADPMPVTAEPPQAPSPVTAVDGTADQGAAERIAVEHTAAEERGDTTGSSALEGTPTTPSPRPGEAAAAAAETDEVAVPELAGPPSVRVSPTPARITAEPPSAAEVRPVTAAPPHDPAALPPALTVPPAEPQAHAEPALPSAAAPVTPGRAWRGPADRPRILRIHLKPRVPERTEPAARHAPPPVPPAALAARPATLAPATAAPVPPAALAARPATLAPAAAARPAVAPRPAARPAPHPAPRATLPIQAPALRPVEGRRERWSVEVSGTGGVLGVLAGTVVAIAVVASAATFLAGRGQDAPPPARPAVSAPTRIPAARAAAPSVALAAQDLAVTATTRSSVTLTWRDANGGRQPYVVLTDAGAATVAPQRAGAATSHVVTGLAPATDYCFTVATGTGAVTPVTMPTCVRTRP